DEREALRKEMIKGLKGRDLGDGLYAVDTSPVNEKFPQTLSNGKKYYTNFYNYEGNEEVPNEILTKLKNSMSENAYNYSRIVPKYFYINKNKLIPINVTVTFQYNKKTFGIFGDEGAGIRFSDVDTIYLSGKNLFYYNGKTFIKKTNTNKYH
ncbi:MAG: tRNA 2-selenouridine synthase, partial [Campylobacter sp.]|nr:tRNA 2-selenouridine synthase [Campylobacter sp.]